MRARRVWGSDDSGPGGEGGAGHEGVGVVLGRQREEGGDEGLGPEVVGTRHLQVAGGPARGGETLGPLGLGVG